jgi:hypothetical protein
MHSQLGRDQEEQILVVTVPVDDSFEGFHDLDGLWNRKLAYSIAVLPIRLVTERPNVAEQLIQDFLLGTSVRVTLLGAMYTLWNFSLSNQQHLAIDVRLRPRVNAWS